MGTTQGRGKRWLLASLLVGFVGCGTYPSLGASGAPVESPKPQVAPAQPRAEATVPTPERPVPVPEPQRPTPTPERPALDPATVVGAVRSVAGRATVGALVLDRTSGTELLAINPDRQFRSASLVKLLIAIDALSRGADQRTRGLITPMLRLSDDGVASRLWVAGGGSALVTRTSAQLGLTGTLPPRTPGQWGDVLLTPHDVGRVYQYVLSALPEQDRTLIVDSLAGAPRRAADGFDQHFGIPDGLGGPFAIKQGWSNSRRDIVLHSSGLVGEGWQHIVVVLTEHPLPAAWRTAARSVTAGAKALSPLL